VYLLCGLALQRTYTLFYFLLTNRIYTTKFTLPSASDIPGAR
jgi:hypothetical protein